VRPSGPSTTSSTPAWLFIGGGTFAQAWRYADKLGLIGLSGKYKDGIPEDSRFAQQQVEFIEGHRKRTGKEQWDGVTKRDHPFPA